MTGETAEAGGTLWPTSVSLDLKLGNNSPVGKVPSLHQEEERQHGIQSQRSLYKQTLSFLLIYYLNADAG